jgi:hypothetical protein
LGRRWKSPIEWVALVVIYSALRDAENLDTLKLV